MKRFFLLGFMALALAVGAPSFAQKPNRKDLAAAIQVNAMRASLFYKALTLASETNSVPEVFKTLEDGMSTGAQTDKATAELWLTDNTFATQPTQDHYNAFYFMFLSDLKAKEAVTAQQLGKTKESDAAAVTALRALLSFEILASADAERCGDESVGKKVVTGLVAQRYRDLRFALKTTVNKEMFDRFAFEAIDIESRKSARPLNLDLCKMGQAAEDPAYKPPVEESIKAWNESRHALRTVYKTVWSDSYYKLREMK